MYDKIHKYKAFIKPPKCFRIFDTADTVHVNLMIISCIHFGFVPHTTSAAVVVTRALIWAASTPPPTATGEGRAPPSISSGKTMRVKQSTEMGYKQVPRLRESRLLAPSDCEALS